MHCFTCAHHIFVLCCCSVAAFKKWIFVCLFVFFPMKIIIIIKIFRAILFSFSLQLGLRLSISSSVGTGKLAAPMPSWVCRHNSTVTGKLFTRSEFSLLTFPTGKSLGMGQKFDFGILMDLHVLRSTESKSVFYKMSVCRLSGPIKKIVTVQLRSNFVMEL